MGSELEAQGGERDKRMDAPSGVIGFRVIGAEMRAPGFTAPLGGHCCAAGKHPEILHFPGGVCRVVIMQNKVFVAAQFVKCASKRRRVAFDSDTALHERAQAFPER